MSDRALTEEEQATAVAARRGEWVEAEIAESETISVILERADAEATQALEALVSADPHNWTELQRLQNEVRRARDIAGWIRQVIEDGRAARDGFEVLQEAADPLDYPEEGP